MNEVISSLLMNYIALFGFGYVIRKPLGDPAAGNSLASKSIPDDVRLPFLPQFFVHYGIFIALALVPFVAYLGRVTPFGQRVRMMGAERRGGRRRRREHEAPDRRADGDLRAAPAGLAGVIQVIGVEGRMDTGISAGYGFTAIIVALLGRLDAFGVLLAALLISFLQTGGQAMSIDNHLPYSIIPRDRGRVVLFVLTADRFAR